MMKLPFMESTVSAGFPSPAGDYIENTLDISEYLVYHPHATFILRLQGDSMVEKKLFDGDLLVVDKSIDPSVGKVVIAEIDGEFLCKELQKDPKGKLYLKAYNTNYSDIYPKSEENLKIWGVVIAKFNKI